VCEETGLSLLPWVDLLDGIDTPPRNDIMNDEDEEKDTAAGSAIHFPRRLAKDQHTKSPRRYLFFRYSLTV
jgi:hypothetical protein